MPLATDRTRRLALSLVATILISLWLASLADAAPRVYWSYFSGTTIGSFSPDGGEVEPGLISEAANPVGVAIDDAHLYWANTTSGTIGRADLDGSNVESAFIEGVEPTALAVVEGHVYWTNANAHTIGRADADGGNVEEGFIGNVGSFFGLAASSGYLYWGNVDDEAIGRARLDGSDVDSEFVKPTGGLIPYGVAADAGHVYWANAVNNAIGRATLGGGEIEEAFIPNAHPAGVAVDTEHVYWGYAIFGEAIGRANIDGSGVDTNFLPQGKAAFGLAAMAAVPAPAPGGGPSEDTQRPGNGPCAPVASSATTFVPTRKPGRVTPGVRAQITVAGGAALRIDATLVYRRNGKTHQASLGSRTVEASPTVKLRLPLPARLRALLPRGAKVRVKLKIAATAGACDPPSVSTHSFRATVVDVLK